MDKTGLAISGDLNKKGNGMKKEHKFKGKTAKKVEVKKDEIESVVENANDNVKDANAEEETWDSKVLEDFDTQLKIHQAKIKITRNLQKITLKDDNQNTEILIGSNDKVVPDVKTTVTGPNYDDLEKNTKESDAEFYNFLKLLDNRRNTMYNKVTEINEDLFKLSNDYSLAHCVAQDLNMSSGISIQFSSKFKRHGVLSNQRQKQGGLAVISRARIYKRL